VLTWARTHARLFSVTQPGHLAGLRWTLDTAGDLATISAIFAALYPQDPRFGSRDVYALLVRRPELIRITGRESLGADERAEWVGRIETFLAAENG
jgi:hypothetical protein